MFQRVLSWLFAFALALFLTACAAPGQQPGEMEIRSGVIEQINFVQLPSNHHAGVGAVVGEATLERPSAPAWSSSGGRRGVHSEAMGYLLAEMQHVARSHPGATW